MSIASFNRMIEAATWDMNVLAQVLNGSAEETVVTRHGDEIPTLAKFFADTRAEAMRIAKEAKDDE